MNPDNHMPSLTGIVPPPPDPVCPDAQFHGRPFRYCSCGWKEQQDCSIDGHDYEHIESLGAGLIALYCPRCERRWKVEEV